MENETFFAAKLKSENNTSFYESIQEFLNSHLKKMKEKYSFDFQNDEPITMQNTSSDYVYYKEEAAKIASKMPEATYLLDDNNHSVFENSITNLPIICPKKKERKLLLKFKAFLRKRSIKKKKNKERKRQLRYNWPEPRQETSTSTKGTPKL